MSLSLTFEMEARQKLERLAIVEKSIAFRLYEVDNWDEYDRKSQKNDVLERDIILSSVDSAYPHRIMLSRVRGKQRKSMPAPWRLKLPVWLSQRI